MTAEDALHWGRVAFEQRAWSEAYAGLSAADGQDGLAPGDLERFAMAAYMLCRDGDGDALLARAHRELLSRGKVARAARCGFWLAFHLFYRGEAARGGGWLARAQRLLDDAGLDCVERGYLLVAPGRRHALSGDADRGYAMAGEAASVGERFGDPDLVTLARHVQGQALVRMGKVAEGTRLLDEAMVSVTAGEVSAMVAGAVYCSMIETCQDIFDVGRAQEWTTELSTWCEAQPDLVLFDGKCLAYRSEVLRLHGDWSAAMGEVQRACDRLSRPPGQPALGMAHYQRAELHRLRGEFDQAEEAYRHASRAGRQPQPGLAMLRLAQGKVEVAAAAIRRALAEAGDWASRSRLLAAHVEVMLAAGDTGAARAGADELSEIAGEMGVPVLDALSAAATGAVLLAEGDVPAALRSLRRGWAAWRDLTMPYEAARTRVLIGLACRQGGERDTAAMELDAARRAFDQLGAVPDARRVRELAGGSMTSGEAPLTARQREVLSLVARGLSNGEIARELVISERTVARHMSNIFTRLGVSSRTAATAFAFEHDLV